MINIGWIGCGTHARQMLLPQMGRNDINIAALCDRDGDALKKTATEYGVEQLTDDFQELIRTPGLDAIGMAVGPELHRVATLAALAREGRGVLVSVHDLSLPLRHATRAVLMQDGRVVADGPPGEVLVPSRLSEVFGVRAHRVETPDGAALVAADLA